MIELERLQFGDKVRIERAPVAIEGLIKALTTDDERLLVILEGDGGREYPIQGDPFNWHVDLIGRAEPPTFSVIQFPGRYDRPSYARRDDGYWALLPSRMDPTNKDTGADRRLTLAQIAEHLGWDFDVVGVGKEQA